MFGGIKVSQMIQEKNQQKKVKIGLLSAPEAFLQLVKKDTLNEITSYTEAKDFKKLITDGTIQTALVFPEDWQLKMDSLSVAEVMVHRNGTKDNVNGRVSKLMEVYESQLKEQRVKKLKIPVAKMTPMIQTYVEVSEQKELIGKRIGGFIPYILSLIHI